MQIGEEISDKEIITRIWKQSNHAVLFNRGKRKRPLIKLPDDPDGIWLRNRRRNKPAHNSKYKCLEFPRTWLDGTVDRVLDRWGSIYVIQRHNVLSVCAPACKRAKGHDCECSCMGEFHGDEDLDRWFVVSETFAVWSEGKRLACRLLKKTKDVPVRIKPDICDPSAA